jgi:hypothetical protein
LVVAWGGALSVMLMQRRAELQGLESKWKQMNDGGQGEADFQKDIDFAAKVVAMNHSRVLVAPQLAMVKDLIPSSIQLARIAFAVSVESLGGDSGGGEEGGESKHPARPKQSKRLVLQLEGVASSARPELEVDQFLKSLRGDARFGELVEDIQLRSIARTSDGDKAVHGLPTVTFLIECWYKEKAKK